MREFYRLVWRSSASQQTVLIVLAVIAAVAATVPLELQRHIINTLAGRERAERLAWLCGAYLAVALAIAGIKYTLNYKSAGLGEGMIRALREDILSGSPVRHTEQIGNATAEQNSGTFVAMIASEAEAVGKFVGDCISTPIVMAGTLLSVLSYMFYTEPILGLVVLLITAPQVVIVPLVQRRINRRVKERVVTLRRAGDLIVEEARDRGRSAGALGRQIGEAFDTIYRVRLRVFRLKFGLKFLTSGSQAIGVFVLLFAGGIMVLHGKTEIGIVVAFITGMDRVLDPWRELIAFVRSTSAAKVQFDLIESTLGRKLLASTKDRFAGLGRPLRRAG